MSLTCEGYGILSVSGMHLHSVYYQYLVDLILSEATQLDRTRHCPPVISHGVVVLVRMKRMFVRDSLDQLLPTLRTHFPRELTTYSRYHASYGAAP
jgi:hypothetical protein